MIARRLHTAESSVRTPPPLEHGGRLREAAARYRIPVPDWLDLSTGINPDGWPVPEVPGTAWARLPEEDDGLEETAALCYGAPGLLPVAGSQAAIQALPDLRMPGRVGVPTVGYQEHAQAWQRAGHTLVRLADGAPGGDHGAGLDDLDVLVVINPNNPTGRRWSVSTLLDWHARLAARGGWLLVDEAFMDTTPRDSLAPYTDRPGLIVLRSLGKFYGLAGVRVGFVLATADLRVALHARLGPWALSGPARHVARLALTDSPWQEATRASLRRASARLAGLLSDDGLVPTGGTELFQWVCTLEAPAIQDRLARQGILVRRFDAPSSLRFGLPGDEAGWARLKSGLCCPALYPPADAFRQAVGETPDRYFSSAAPTLASASAPVPGTLTGVSR
ncbi:threonine-phosphate decarboxylase CobD [Thiocapsa rosea]|uniref:threonine-phosphate decarboxylase n=1 Tax=Thiocapsa rosea TaxID=69360 RepID=A0A495VCY3_9GAMM|nr:threonine-phosphate decarboxylase CobD [Thiocapsa rosea]RKT47276.1 L-threonine O-3-phosphate decarboxylase [Thiocapsa rosea]